MNSWRSVKKMILCPSPIFSSRLTANCASTKPGSMIWWLILWNEEVASRIRARYIRLKAEYRDVSVLRAGPSEVDGIGSLATFTAAAKERRRLANL